MIDLHMHTLYSDGTDTEIELLEAAQKAGLNTIAITDHNTAKVYEVLENVDIDKYLKGKIITGIELNTTMCGVPIEILGFGFDYKLMNEKIKEVYMSAEERNKIEARRLYEACLKAGFKLEENCVDHFDGSCFASRFIQSEICKHEENRSLIDPDSWNNLKNFYRKYMSNPEGPLYLDMTDIIPDFNTAANLVRECGGLVFIPHIFEYRDNSRKILNEILENYEFDGIECFYTNFTDEQTEEMVNLCKERGIYMSGGSDYHGKAKPDVAIAVGHGNLNIQDTIMEPWKDKLIYYKK